MVSEREGTGKPVIFDVVFAIFKNLFFRETETDGRKIMPQQVKMGFMMLRYRFKRSLG